MAAPVATEVRRLGLAARAEGQPAPLTGAQLVIAELERRGIEIVAGIPGGAILPLYDALQASRIRHVLARHEQGAAFIAQGMARASGKVAVCLATSGPGATNLITALADARADSIPLLAITAQVPQKLIGTDAFQEVDTCALARPVTKACFFARSATELAQILPRAFELAESGRPGPVLVDIPKCVLNERLPEGAPVTQPAVPAPASAAAPGRVAQRLDADLPATWPRLAAEIAASERPLLYIGGGVHAAGAYAELLALSRRADLPVVSSLHGLGAYPADDPRFLGMLGMHGAPYTNHATEEADLVIAVGARFDDRATGDPERFCRNARILHFDIDERELGKIKPVEFGVRVDARLALARLLEWTAPATRTAWRQRIDRLRAERPLVLSGQGAGFLQRLSAELDPRTIITTDVGQHQMWVAQCMPFRQPRTLLTSGGLGTMGFGLPAAIGAALAAPARKVVCVSGDGSLLMNLQELATLAELGLDVTTFVMNNSQLGLVRQQQQLFYGQRYSAAHFERGSDFAALARAFGLRGERAPAHELTGEALRALLEQPGPLLVDVRLPGTENVLPMVPPGASNLDMIVED
ncbi:MAG TPA: biosynthetic-type acetolactate synthase large subunit [Polyangiaceae bacterium]|jgi:acetolactate synthase-1/2/3 large subunit|nr:biosynthetic-type acetolactate synthase large subunit [Polyangiaceae bacterium]